MIKVGIVGIAGYGGGELARLLGTHPNVELVYATSNSYAGKAVASCFGGQAKRSDLICEIFDPQKASANCDFLFLAGEAGLAMKIAPDLLKAGVKLCDLSADFRLKNVADFQNWYKMPHVAVDLLQKVVYGLPEFYRGRIQSAQFVANPGCYPTSAVLALAPLLKAGIIDPATIIIDSYSGVSGAGRSKFGLDYHFAEVNEALKPYAAGGVHRHVPEIEQVLSDIKGSRVTVTFTPHLAPITRGILTTAYANLSGSQTLDELHGLLVEAYKNEPAVVVLEKGSYPSTKYAYGANACHIGISLDERTGRVILFSAIDNLVKGMAGQAIQNMNLMCGFEEQAGLNSAGLWP